MRFGVLASPDSWYLKDLRRAAAGRHDVVGLSFADIRASLGGPLGRTAGAASSAFVEQGGVRSVEAARDWSTFDAIAVRTMPPGSLEQVVFRMDVLGRFESAGVVVVNPARSVEAAVDKYLTSAKLAAVGLDSPRTIVCQTPDDALEAFEQLGRDVVLKPLFGSEGRGIVRLNDPDLALRAFKLLAQLGAVLYLQEYVEHEGYDLRLLVVGDEVLGMRRRNELDWRTNVSRGAQAEPFVPDERLIEMARRATDAVGAWIAGVDLLPAR
ncbi:MAG TPA: RimK family alpha-L-glutamate ligase, partial [Pirellulaceae bacterium]|nr:RimK family alpha-L-glutamate ligase [Pirellulaceae bacterium]